MKSSKLGLMKRLNILRFLLIYLLCTSGLLSNNNQTSKIIASVKVLFLGNSLTGHSLPEVVNRLTDNTKNNIYVDDIILYGHSLYEISQSDSFTTKLSSERWDYIVMQESPYRIAYPDSFPRFPIRYALDRIKNMAYDNDKDTKLMFFMPYAYKDGMAWYKNYTDDFFEMQQKIYDNSIIFANDYNMKIAPVGWAWYNVMYEGSAIELYTSDMSHPTVEGTYLSACVIYSSIFEDELINNHYISTISYTSAYYLQSVASSTVLDGLDSWNYLSTVYNHNKITEDFSLNQNYPNPFNPETTISFDLPEYTNVNISIYNLRGNKVSELLNKSLESGSHKIIWDGIDDNGKQVSGGVYLYKVHTDKFSQTKKMILLR